MYLLRKLSSLTFTLSLFICCASNVQISAYPQPQPQSQLQCKPVLRRAQCAPQTKKLSIPTPVKESLLTCSKPKLKPPLKPLIVLDAGHGGKDLGAHSTKVPKYQEKNLTLATVHHLKQYLEQMGYNILLTRHKDEFLELEERSTFANERNPLVFVSIHYNSAPSTQAEGIEIFYYHSVDDKERADKSKALGQSILKHMVTQTQAKSRGVKSKNLAVIRETTMPAVLVEGGFLTHPNEVVNLKNGLYLKKLAWGVAQGINDYLMRNHPLLQPGAL